MFSLIDDVVVVGGVDLKKYYVFDHRHGGQVWEKAGMFEQDQLLRHKTKSRSGEHRGFEIIFAYMPIYGRYCSIKLFNRYNSSLIQPPITSVCDSRHIL